MAYSPGMARSHFPVWLIAAFLVLATIALYWPAMRCDFVNYDDPPFVTANPQVQNGLNWEGVKWAFHNTEQAAYWAPLVWLSHMLACQWFGLNPWGHHLVNVLLHAANTALVFLLLRRMTGATWRSLMVAALFGLHPLRVESVVWVTERKDVLSTCFGLLALLFYTGYLRQVASGERRVTGGEDRKSSFRAPLVISVHYWLALFFFICGLMSKPMLVTWPFVLLLLDYWPLGRFRPSTTRRPPTLKSQFSAIWRLAAEKIPFFAFAAVASVVTFTVQRHGGSVVSGESLPLGARAANALVSYCRYLGKLFWPADLAVFYPHPGYWPIAKVLLAAGLLLGISVLFIVMRRRHPFLLVGWLWYCGTLVPAIGLVQSGAQAMADRFTYVPSPGLLILAIWGAHELTMRWRYHVIALSVAGTATIVLCIALTRQQIGYWKDSETLFRHALDVTENNYLAHDNLGVALGMKGQIDEATSQLQEAVRLKPDDAEARNNLGNALSSKGQLDEAICQYQEAVRLKLDNAEAHNNLGNALSSKGQLDEAISQFQEAFRLKPDFADAHYNLGIALVRKSQIDEAAAQFREVIRLKPGYAEAHSNLGAVLVMKGKTNEAIRQFQEAIRLKPDYPNAHCNLGTTLLNQGRIDEAITQLREALRLKPDYGEARTNLRNALARKGQSGEATK